MASLRTKFGRNIKYLRKKAGLTQEELAEKSAISIDFLSLIERGINAPSFETIEKISKALNIEISQLFTFTK